MDIADIAIDEYIRRLGITRVPLVPMVSLWHNPWHSLACIVVEVVYEGLNDLSY
jgi:hypothetical protein